MCEVRYCQVDHFRVLGDAVCTTSQESTVLESSMKSTVGGDSPARDCAIVILLLL